MLKIYLTDLCAYNKGYLIGEWISFPCDDLQSKLDKILRSGEALCFMEQGYFEKHEEWFVTDYDWEEVDLFCFDEYKDIFKLNEMLFRLNDLDKDQLKAIKFLLEQSIASDIENAITKADDVIIHPLTDLKSHVYDLLQELYDLNSMPTIITNNIDYEGIAYELDLEGRYVEINGDLYEYVG